MRHLMLIVGSLVGLASCHETSSQTPSERSRLEMICGCVPAPSDMPFPDGSPELWCYDDAQHGIWGMSYKYH